MILRPSLMLFGLGCSLVQGLGLLPAKVAGPHLDKRQTAAPFPPLVYSTDFGTGSVDPSLQTAAVTAGASANAILSSSEPNTATAMVPGFAPTSTREDTILPLATTGTFTFTSGNPQEVLSSNTRPDYTATGTINLNEQSNLATPSRAAASSLRPIMGEQSLAIGISLFIGLASLSAFLL